MLLIFEGPDGSGKTTLIEKFISQSDRVWDKRHFSNPKTIEDQVNMAGMYMDLVKEAETKDIIMDRSWYSELVYGPIFRGESCISYKDLFELEVTCYNCRAIVVYVSVGIDTLWERCLARGETFVKTKKILKKVSEGYEDLLWARQLDTEYPRILVYANGNMPVEVMATNETMLFDTIEDIEEGPR